MNIIYLKKERCRPCYAASAALTYILNNNHSLTQYIHIYDKETVPELVTKYKTKLYPTAILVDEHGDEIERITGGKALKAAWINLFDKCLEGATTN
jgi:thioredoxin-related protein